MYDLKCIQLAGSCAIVKMTAAGTLAGLTAGTTRMVLHGRLWESHVTWLA